MNINLLRIKSYISKTFATIIFLIVYTLLIVFLTTNSKNYLSLRKQIHFNEKIYMSQNMKKYEEQKSAESEAQRFDDELKSNYEKTISEQIREITGCIDTIQKPSIRQNGDFWILYNYVVSETQFHCSETITYVTHGDYTFLDNIVPLVTRWMGPVSIAIHAPGDDYQKTVDSIRYLRQCGPEALAKYVTFHIYFNNIHMSKNMFGPDYLESSIDCGGVAPYLMRNGTKTYKEINNMTYPINVGRNIARNGAQTHFIMVSDIELYPSKDIIPKFLKMIAKNRSLFGEKNNKKVFPIPIFEVEKDQDLPDTKTKLQELVKEKKAIFFHQKVCPICHKIPKLQEWINTAETPDLNIFVSGKRSGNFRKWEPIFIGTNQDPFYEERQSWEGMSEKMTQAYVLCVLDYDFMVLDNVFLCHKPGIKLNPPSPERYKFISNTSNMISNKILPELKILYGERNGCQV